MLSRQVAQLTIESGVTVKTEYNELLEEVEFPPNLLANLEQTIAEENEVSSKNVLTCFCFQMLIHVLTCFCFQMLIHVLDAIWSKRAKWVDYASSDQGEWGKFSSKNVLTCFFCSNVNTSFRLNLAKTNRRMRPRSKQRSRRMRLV